jgi:hypothetical protein
VLSSPAEYAGRYYSEEIDSTFVVTVKDTGLTVQRDTDAAPAALVPSAVDEFRFAGMTVRFVRGANRAVQALEVDAGRVRGIRFNALASSR